MTGKVLHTKAYDNNPYPRWWDMIFIACFVAFLYFVVRKEVEAALMILVPLVITGRKLYQYIRDPTVGATHSTPMHFSDTRLIFGDRTFELKDIEVIAVYLNSYDGFKFSLPGGGMGRGSGTEDGNGSQISVRTNDQMIHDYNFYLCDFEQFSLMRKLLVVWQEAGVNVTLEQAYTDEYMLAQMTHFGS